MQCPHCHQEHPADSLFCPLTGKKMLLPGICPECGQPVDPGWQHCSYCGRMLILEVGDSQIPIKTPELSPTTLLDEPGTQNEETGLGSLEEPPAISQPGVTNEIPSETLFIQADEPEPAPHPGIGPILEKTNPPLVAQIPESPVIQNEPVQVSSPEKIEIQASGEIETGQITGEPTLRCPHCNEEHPADSQFCPMTGQKIFTLGVCPECSQPVDPSWFRCGNCGRELIPAEVNQSEMQAAGDFQTPILTPGLPTTLNLDERNTQAEAASLDSAEEPPDISQSGATDEMPSKTFTTNPVEPEPVPYSETGFISEKMAEKVNQAGSIEESPALSQHSAENEMSSGTYIAKAGKPEPEEIKAAPLDVQEISQVALPPLIQSETVDANFPAKIETQVPGEIESRKITEPVLRCPHCNEEHPADLRFCPLTGKKISLPKVCPECGQPINPGWQHCGYCGYKLPEEVPTTAPGKTTAWVDSPKARRLIILGCLGGVIIVTVICALLMVGLFVWPGFWKPAHPESVLPTSTEITFAVPTLSPTGTIAPLAAITPTVMATLTPVQTGTPWPSPRLTYPCISYYDESKGDLKFICRSKNQWEPASVVDPSGDVGLFSSLAFDPKGLAHISYYSQSEDDLKYAFQDGSKWVVETVDTSGDVGLFTSLVLDWDGNAFIGYYDRTNQSLKLARQQNGKWDLQTVDQIGPLKSTELRSEQTRISLALDRRGYPLISYLSQAPHHLRLARWTGSDYEIETVDVTPDVGGFSSLALNSQGYPLISYYDKTNEALKLAEWDGQKWNLEVVDDSGANVGQYTSLALDPKDNLYISYFVDEPNADYLKVAIRKNGAWNFSSFNSGYKKFRLGWGYHTSIALDARDNPYVAFFANTAEDLNVQYWIGTTPLRFYVDSGGSVGLYPSIKFIPDYSGQ